MSGTHTVSRNTRALKTLVNGLKNGNNDAIVNKASHKPLSKVFQFWRHSTWKQTDNPRLQLMMKKTINRYNVRSENNRAKQDKQQDNSSSCFLWEANTFIGSLDWEF